MTQVEGVEVSERGERGGYGSGEAVVGQGHDSEFSELGELDRDGTGDDSGGEDELSQLGESGDGSGE